MNNNYQRANSLSNAAVGQDFEDKVQSFFKTRGLTLYEQIGIEIGTSTKKKTHKFDLGNHQEKIVIECKSHKWTAGENVPSAKLTTWDQAMYFFFLTPNTFRKIFVVLYDYSEKHHESLGEYYLRTKYHLIPDDVELWEFNETENTADRIN
jgi:hypothetical protein